MRLSLLFSTLLIGAAIASAAGPVITIDENGNGTVNSAPLPYHLGTDPNPGAHSLFTNVLTYSPLPFAGVAGDVEIFVGSLPVTVFRFNGDSTILVYAGANRGQNGTSLATQYTPPIPPNGVTNFVNLTFTGSIMTYTPNVGQPGYDATNPTYVFLFPTTQAPSNILNAPGSNLRSAFQLNYATHFDVADAILNVTNGGSSAASTAPGSTVPGTTTTTLAGDICVNVYVYQPNDQLATCCSCAVAPNGLYSWPVSFGTGNLLTHVSPKPSSVVIKLVATAPAAGSTSSNVICDAGFQNAPFSLVPGMTAWGTRSHITNTGTVAITETPYAQKPLSQGEATKLQSDCRALGLASQCPVCANGGLAQPALTPSF